MSEPTVSCPNCSKSIPSSAYSLHEVHCQRNYQRCSCGEVVKKAEMKTHMETRHSQFVCENCSETMARYLKDSHKCQKLPRLCDYCEAQIRYDDYAEHVDMCGSRTRPCPTCHGLIKLREYQAHRAAGNCLPPLPSSPPNRFQTVVEWPRRPAPPARPQPSAQSGFFSGPNVKGPFRIDDGDDVPVAAPTRLEPEEPTEEMLLEQAIAMSLAETHSNPMQPVPSFPAPYEEVDEDLQAAIRESLRNS